MDDQKKRTKKQTKTKLENKSVWFHQKESLTEFLFFDKVWKLWVKTLSETSSNSRWLNRIQQKMKKGKFTNPFNVIKLNSFNTERKRAASSSSRSPDMNCCCCSSSFCNTCSISVIRLSEFKTFYDASLQRKSFVRSRLLTSRPRLDRKAQKLRHCVALLLCIVGERSADLTLRRETEISSRW